MSTSKSQMYTANMWCCNLLNKIDVYFKAHMYTANVWCCNISNIDVYFKVTHVYSKWSDVVICRI